jgi:hypothetical protein
MKRHILAFGLVSAGMAAMTLAGGSGSAHADDPFSPAGPGIVDFITAETPDLYAPFHDEGGSSTNSNRSGMYCQNYFVRCH